MELGMKTSRLGALVAVMLALPTSVWAQGGAEGTTPLFTVNLGTTVWTAIVFLALLGILWRFAWGPILEAVEARESGIQSKLDEAASRNEEAAKLLAEHKEQLADARRQANELIAEGRAAGEHVRAEIEERARAESQAMVERARGEIERERDRAIDALRKESVDLALAAASRLMQENLDQDKNRQLVERYLSEMGSA
jgi:F-type H+-transporting ATPase subunit b